MTSRERFHRAINHQEPDRVPIDVGQDFHNGLHEVAYRNLLAYLGETDEIRIYDQMQHLAVCKQSVLERLHGDTRYFMANAGADFNLTFDPDGSWLDEWGVRRVNCGLYDENVGPALAECTLEDVKKYRMPDPCDPHRFKDLKATAKKLYETTDYAVIGANAASLFFLSSEIIGYQEYMEKILTEPLLIETLVDRILEFQMAYFDRYLDEVGEYVELVWMGDDWGTQMQPLMNPRLFREIFARRYRIFTDMVHKKTKAKVALHSCGRVEWAMNDLIDAGIDVLHPLQGDALNMGDAAGLKKAFGDKLVFYSNLSNQTILPFGTPEMVRQEVREKIQALAPGGGYIISAGHNIQADVPPENILALYDAAVEHGKY